MPTKKVRTAPKPAKHVPRKTRVVETFSPPADYDLDRTAKMDTPFAWNGIVHIHKYRVLVEELVEPNEVIRERIIDLWRRCNNHHATAGIKREAERYGFDIHAHGDSGCDRVFSATCRSCSHVQKDLKVSPWSTVPCSKCGAARTDLKCTNGVG